MGNVLDIFNQRVMLDYTRTVEKPPFALEALFPERKQFDLKFTQLQGAGSLPVAATVHAFDTEAEIGSRQAESRDLELFLIKRKLQLKEEQIIALESPRNQAEKNYLMNYVFNDVDTLTTGVKARVEAMRGEALANGTIEVKENNLSLKVDYGVPATNQEALSGTNLWTSAESDPFDDMARWNDVLGTNPTRALTSRKVLMALLRHPLTKSALGKGDSGIVTIADLNGFLVELGLPQIATYDETYRVQKADGTYETKRYFPENKFVMFSDNILGETIYGPTAEEIRLTRDPSIEITMDDKVLAMVYEENVDPVGTWIKAVATAVPSFPAANEVFQAKPVE